MAASKIAHLILDPAKALTMHAGLRSHQRDFTWDALKHVATNGISKPHPEGDHKLLTEARDPQNPDVYWKVATDNNPVTKFLTVMKDTSRPMKDVELAKEQGKASEQAKVESKQRSARNKKAQLEKKHKRNPPKDKK
jgi:hypothetical protein